MNTLQNEIINTRKIYRELFNNARSAIERQIDSLKKASLCNHCKQGCDIDFNKITVLQKFPDGCRYKFWQESVLNLLENQISKDIYERIQIIEKRRQTYSCACCSSCCKLASSEYSFEELKQRAKNGDVFSKEFISVFVPYDSVDTAQKLYTDYVKLLREHFKDNELYFYYCPKLGPNGLCTDYENRPNICRDFPNNPLVALPLKCSYNEWKQEVEITALTLHALIDIIGYYKQKINEVL